MSRVNGSRPSWGEDFAGVAGDAGVGYNSTYYATAGPGGSGMGATAAAAEPGSSGGDYWRFQVVEFAKGFAEMSLEFGKGVRDVVMQTVATEDSVIAKKLRGPCGKICTKLRFLNEYLPEDRDPVHSWSVIFFVAIIAFAALIVNNDADTTSALVKKVNIHPPSASRILLPDGRYLAYQEQGVPADQARFSVVAVHSFLSSRLAGIPGIKVSLLQQFGVRLVTYDLPGFGESDPHPNRNLESSAMDMLHLSYAVNITGKFWVVGFSSGSLHCWAALRYIPDRVAGAFMVAPMVNPYEPSMTKQERNRMWKKWAMRKKIMYILGHKFPRLLPFFYRRAFLSGIHGPIDERLSLSLGTRDRALIESPLFEEFWQRDVEESVRQKNVRPLVEEAALQVSNWGFSLADLKVHRKPLGKGILKWLKSLYGQAEESLSGFLGPIHIWLGMEDMVVPPSTSVFLQRVLPDAMVHKLLYEGHFTYFYFCNECHRQIFTTIFGDPQGPLIPEVVQTPINEETPINEDNEETDNIVSGEIATDAEIVSSPV
ncbi:uncharacterized protein LOC116004925 [Ipomoea triloba]|uniref:uncharacterized protein LOC116004925 n=1 Tax=Ipomoea triloba TaxID=35885 RepID=UPI00125E7828|nr:uncharacterized protein LOC116004925 [Ipomoea triloba]